LGINDENGHLLTNRKRAMERWHDYFERISTVEFAHPPTPCVPPTHSSPRSARGDLPSVDSVRKTVSHRMFGCVTHQPRRHRPRNFEDEPSNLRSRSFDPPSSVKALALPPPKSSGRQSSVEARPASTKGA
uniref:Uncharacterized protein n=1 Tax=Heligmosomoides polygyrus TaxID=6339 RepID=A0A183GRS3_HELPZ